MAAPGVGMHVNDVGSDGDMHRHRNPQASRRRQHAEIGMRRITRGEPFRDPLSESAARPGSRQR